MQIEQLKEKMNSKKITKAKFNLKKQQIDTKIHGLNARIRVLQGGISKEKKHQEEKAKEKEEKKSKKKK